MTQTAVIVQARMGSTRLPQKVMMPLAGQTVLAHVLERCRAIDGVDTVCCATTIAPEDAVIVAEAERCGAAVFRGSPTDVLDRYARAAKMVDADVVMRVTSDCPLIDPEICAAVLRLRAEKGVEYAANNMPPGWPHGLDCEAFSADALARAAKTADDPLEREHVTPWLRNNPSISRASLKGPGGSLTDLRWTLDYPEDMDFFEALFAKLPNTPSTAGTAEVLEILQRFPEISAINQTRRDNSRKT
ncbi:MAG: glycosyltransferase family protein [Alphaproteobacteria bacterium]|nr:glycosyltransferase family protein [Alphaproteobacteria bacterium]MBL6945291.1 glycosyltransferase family protein [Rhodospirillales bacterium]